MARLQILNLPLVDNGDGTHEQPFALIIDDFPMTGSEESIRKNAKKLHKIAKRLGARGALVTDTRLDIVDPHAEATAKPQATTFTFQPPKFDMTKLMQSLSTFNAAARER